MKKHFAFHPPLFAIFPVLSVYSANLSLIPIADLWLPVALCAAGSLLVWLILLPIVRDAARAAAGASVISVSVLLYGRTFAPIDTRERTLVLLCWGLATLLIAGLLMWKAYRALFWNMIGVLLVLVSGSAIAFRKAGAAVSLRRPLPEAAESKPLVTGKPDIFYVILDGHGRQDMLKRYIGYDNGWFIKGLRDRGFYVADKARTNYAQTEQSLASSLNHQYLHDLLPVTDARERYPLDVLITDNATVRDLRRTGYVFTAVTSGFPALEFRQADLWLREPTHYSYFADLVLQETPLRETTFVGGSQFEQRRKLLRGAFTATANEAKPTARPKFVFSHILAPHPPFVFGPDGEPLKPRGPYGFFDASEYMACCGTPETYIAGYKGQVEYIEKLTLQMVDDIRKRNPKAIVIVQGDHGTKVHLDQNSSERTDPQEVFPTLVAVAGPPQLIEKLYEEITPVNLMRIVHGAVTGRVFPRLPDRSYLSTFGAPYKYEDVTARVK